MSSYLDTYGVKDAKRERLRKRIAVSVLLLAILSTTLWFLFRDYREESRVKEFISLLDKKEYKAAYSLFGCTDSAPCRDYSFPRFLEDWGPNVGSVTRQKVKSCEGGIIQAVTVQGKETLLYVDRQTLLLGFSPWPVCTPRVKV